MPYQAIPNPPGELVDLGGYRIHVQQQGSGPPVVFDSGLGAPSLLWANVLPPLGKPPILPPPLLPPREQREVWQICPSLG